MRMPSLKRILQTVSMRQTLTRLKSSLTSTSSSAIARLRLVVPHFHFDAPVQGAALRRRVGRDRLRRAGPLIGDRLGRQSEARLQELGDFAGALARQARVVAVDARKLVGQRLIVGMADEVQPHVAPVAQIIEHLAQRFDVALRDVRDARFEPDRRDDVRELHRRHPLGMHRAHLDAVARLLLQQVADPAPTAQRLVGRQIALDSLAERRLDDVLRLRCQRRTDAEISNQR